MNDDLFSCVNRHSLTVPRLRRVHDTAIIHAAAAIVAARGAHNTRLSDISAACGLAPATLVQRFGTLDALLDAVGESYVQQIQQLPETIPDLPAALAQIDMVRHLAFFAARAPTPAPWSRALTKTLAYALSHALAQREIAPLDVAATSHRLKIALLGYLSAALLEGTPVTELELRDLIELQLADYR
jgi:AcrR family transcriptional regulator